MVRYKCKVCGYIYDPEKGEPRRNTESGIIFEACQITGAALPAELVKINL